jgi:hypothetical protein
MDSLEYTNYGHAMTTGICFWTIARITGVLVYRMGFTFVDDIDLFHTGQYLQTGKDLIPEMQQAINA